MMQFNKFTHIRTLTVLLLCFVTAILVEAQKVSVPAEIQVKLIAKILPLDRAFENRVGNEIIIGILYQEKYRESSLEKNNLLNSFNDLNLTSIDSLPLKFIPIELKDMHLLDSQIINENIDVLILTPVRSVDFDELFLITQKNKVLSISGVSKYVQYGASIGFGVFKEKPKIIINHKSAVAEGADFKPKLLQISKVINSDIVD